MVKFKKLKTVLTSLLLAGAIASAGAAAASFGGVTKAYAADRQVELDGNSVFYRAIRGAEITASNPVTQGEGDDAKSVSYVKFEIGEEQSITYRQNLAYTWLKGNKVKNNGADANFGESYEYYDGTYTRNYFSMSLSFESLNFKRFYIKLQSQQYVLTKDGVTDNYIIFTPTKDGEETKIQVSVAQSLDEDDDKKIKEEDISSTGLYKADTVFDLSFNHNKFGDANQYKTTDYDGDYDLLINGSTTDLKIKNVYEQFASYVSSGDTAATPLTFSAQFDGSTSEKNAEVVLRNINGQSFEVVNYDDVKNDGDNPKIEDNASPVMCFTETPSYIKYGDSISLKYRVIDVLASAPRATAYYYVLTGKQYADDFNYNWTKSDFEEANKKNTSDSENSEEKEEDEEDAKLKDPYIQVSSSSGARVIRDDETFNPQIKNVFGLVKIYYEIADVSGSSKKDDVIFVDWYAKEDSLVDIYSDDYKNEAGKQSKFIKLIDDKPGVTYAQENIYSATTTDELLTEYKKGVKAFERAYQKAIDDAISELEGQKLYAGGEKFYLPAIEKAIAIINDGELSDLNYSGYWNFMDDYFTSRDYKYSIYYKAKNSGSNTSLNSNMLAMDLNDADVTYTFTLYITDGFGNDMRYPASIDEKGEIVWEKISSSEVWDDDYADILPRFTVDVSYKKATAENPESLSLAYVNTNYSGVSFKITGVSGTYKASYNLYIFDRNAFNKGEGKNLTYSEFVANFDKLFKNEFEGVSNSRKYFTTVKEASQLLETDENYKLFKAINWNSSTLNFTPQSVEEFYIVTLTLTDNRSQDTSPYFATVAASVQPKSLKGENDWLEQNVTSVVLLAVAGVCLIALLILLVVKPKDKGDIDVVYAEVEGKQEKKDKKKNK